MLDFSNKSMDDLQTTIQDLSNKLNFAQRSGKTQMVNQIMMYLDMCRTEYSKRMDELYKKQNIQNNIKINSK
jgi:hypothetical protein